jgi:hypothetical protein
MEIEDEQMRQWTREKGAIHQLILEQIRNRGADVNAAQLGLHWRHCEACNSG